MVILTRSEHLTFGRDVQNQCSCERPNASVPCLAFMCIFIYNLWYHAPVMWMFEPLWERFKEFLTRTTTIAHSVRKKQLLIVKLFKYAQLQLNKHHHYSTFSLSQLTSGIRLKKNNHMLCRLAHFYKRQA